MANDVYYSALHWAKKAEAAKEELVEEGNKILEDAQKAAEEAKKAAVSAKGTTITYWE